MRSRAALAVLLAMGLVLTTGVVADRAWSDPGTTCSFSADLTFEPGLSPTPSSGEFKTIAGDEGAFDCDGPLDYGKEATGPGAFKAAGLYGTTDDDSCDDGGEGTGTLRYSYPASGGTTGKSEADFTFTYSAFDSDGISAGTFESDKFDGTFEVSEVDGDCVTTPLTKIHIEGEGVFK